MAGLNAEVARLLRELTELMVLDEGSPQAFRARAYANAARAVDELSADVADLSAADLAAVSGIGKSSAAKIREYVEGGSIARLDELRARYPAAFVALTRIPGLGPKTAVMLRRELGVESVEDLEAAIAAEKLRDLPGLGARTEEKLARAISRMGLAGKERRTPILDALPLALELVEALRDCPGVTRIEHCGSLRRFRETVGDIDIVVASRRPEPVMERFVGLPAVREVLGHGDTKSSVLIAGGLQVDLRVVEPDSFGAAIQYFTGSKEHNVALRARAQERGWTLNEYALADVETGAVVASRTEAEIYAALGLDFVPPELREGSGEIEAAAAGELPALVEEKHLKGDLHCHSDWSGDGRSSLEDMVAAARDRGLRYLVMSDHAEDLAINGLSRAEMLRQRERLRALQEETPDIRLLHGAELNIGPDGSLDYDDQFLMGFDFGVASVHSHFDLPAAEQTARVIRAIRHPAVNVIGHLTGRRVGRRPGIELDFDAVFAAAAETETALEINGHLDRLDVPADVIRRRRGAGVRYAIDTDAHHVAEFSHHRWGVHVARRGWVERDAVVNTWPLRRFLSWVKRVRSA